MGEICRRCVLDTTVPDLKFDDNGVCNYCHLHDIFEKKYPLNEEGKRRMKELVEKIKESGKGKEFDCVIGVSGGVDSTYTLYIAKELGLRPLAVHMDNGWNSNIAVSNIERITNKLGIPLHTIVLDWEEFKDLQISFLKASVSDAEIPTDIAIMGSLHKVASQEGIKYVISGHSFRTQGSCPKGWTYMDGKYIKSVQKKFGKKKLRNFPNMTITKLLYYMLLKKIKVVSLLEYLDYRKEEAKKTIKDELGWKPYGGKHYESVYTRFFQSYILPEKFNIDKRKVHYSALIRSGQMTREEAFEKLKEPPAPKNQIKDDREYVIKKLGLSEEEFEKIMKEEPKYHDDYKTYKPLIKKLKFPIKIACSMHLLPVRFYEKYAKD